MEVPEEDKKLIKRWHHGGTAVAINFDCMEVMLFGGWNKNGSLVADTVVVRFGKCYVIGEQARHL